MPPESEKLARQFKAFARARKVKSVAELIRLVLLHAGLDYSAREVAANFVHVNPEIESPAEQSVLDRLHACLLWLQALVPALIERQPLPELPSGLSLWVLDALEVTAPGLHPRFSFAGEGGGDATFRARKSLRGANGVSTRRADSRCCWPNSCWS